MNDAMTDGKLQVTAAVALLEHSRLVDWVPERCAFVPVTREAFETSWRRDVDPVFGRVICWISFAAGAEFLAKGTCLARGVEIRKPKRVPAYPTSSIEEWVSQFLRPGGSYEKMDVTNFGTLGNLTQAGGGLTKLCTTVSADAGDKDLLLAGYKLLQKSIRNRDAHAYVPNVRDWHFDLVPELFTRCFNILTSWLPDGPSTLNQWRSHARQFVTSTGHHKSVIREARPLGWIVALRHWKGAAVGL